MKRQQKPDLHWFTYSYQSCMCVDSLSEYIEPPIYV